MKESKQIPRKNAGMTMVEILVAFTVMLLLIAAFTKCISFTSAVVRKANDASYQADALQKEYVTDSLEKVNTLFSGTIHFTEKGQESEQFSSDTSLQEGKDETSILYYFGEHKMVTN